MIIKNDTYMHHSPNVILLQLVDEREMESMARMREVMRELSDDLPFLHVALQVENWNRDLSPWKANAVFGKEAFDGEGSKTLEEIEQIYVPQIHAMPEVREYADRAGIALTEIPLVIGGYSLSGLFALWAYYEGIRRTFEGRPCIRYNAVAGVSPSVWYPGWIDYVCEQTDTRLSEVEDMLLESEDTRRIPESLIADEERLTDVAYLSLGRKEEQVRNAVMSTVGTAIRQQSAIFRMSDVIQDTILEWNLGNHFADTDRRTAQGFAWVLKRLEYSELLSEAPWKGMIT